MRRFIMASITAALLAGTSAPAIAQGPFSPLVYVNNAAVTQYELDQRLRFMQLLRAPNANRETALRELVNDRLKMQAAALIGVAVSDKGLEQGLTEFAGRANMDVATFTEELARNGVERQAYRDFVKSGVAWREVVRQRIVPQIKVSDREIDQAMKREIETPLTDQVLLSELVIPAPLGQEAQARALGERLATSIKSEAEFAAAARRYSATPTAGRGGRLEWTPLANLPPALQQIVMGIQPGSVSPTLTVTGAVVLFFLRDTRGRLRSGATDQIVEYLVMNVPSSAEGRQILARVNSCDDVHVEANRYTPDPVTRETVGLGQVPGDLGQRLASLDDNEGTVVDYGAGARLLMLCSRKPALADAGTPTEALPGIPIPRRAQPLVPDAAAAPDAANAATDAAVAAGVAAPTEPTLTGRDDTRQVLMNRKINAAADAYLAELRADAIIRKP